MLQSDPFSRSVELFREVCTSLLSTSEAFMSWQIDQLQESITRNTQQLRTALSEAGSAQSMPQWPDALQNGLRDAIKTSRDNLVASSDYQLVSLRLLQTQQQEIQQIITEALNEQIVNIDVAASREKRNGKSMGQARQKIAA